MNNPAIEKLINAVKLINREYETEYDGRMYTMCSSCGAQDDQKHKVYCGWPKLDDAIAALSVAKVDDAEMVERVAKALYDDDRKDPGAIPWEKIIDYNSNLASAFRSQARAAISAMENKP